MGIIYNEDEPAPAYPMNIYKMNPNKIYRKHLENLFFLRFMAQHEDTDWLEKRQAEREIPIAERKMAFWERHPNFDKDQMVRDTEEVKRQWRTDT